MHRMEYDDNLTYYIGQCKTGEFTLPQAPKRISFGWNSAPVAPHDNNKDLMIHWKDICCKKVKNDASARFRVTVALDMREEALVDVFLESNGKLLGTFNIQYAMVFQIFELNISAADAMEAFEHGIRLRMVKGENPLWIISSGIGSEGVEAVLLPHIIFEEDMNKYDMFLKKLCSTASIQLFGWLEGCVLDGLIDLYQVSGEKRFYHTAESHLKLYIAENGDLIYENPRSEAFDGKLYGIESTLPFAAIAQLFPNNPVIDLAIEFWTSNLNENDAIIDWGEYTAEGCYTVAYPMAVISILKDRKDLAELALKQLRLRIEHLTSDNNLYLRSKPEGKSYKNWARAYSWYMLGLIRVIRTLGDKYLVDDLKYEFKRISSIVLNYQKECGLWDCYLGEDQTGIDTSGSAGIAAALAMGYKDKILDVEAHKASINAFEALKGYLTFDGLLTGVAQGNKGGEMLQRSGYRVISQMAMGLLAQLGAAIESVMNNNGHI